MQVPIPQSRKEIKDMANAFDFLSATFKKMLRIPDKREKTLTAFLQEKSLRLFSISETELKESDTEKCSYIRAVNYYLLNVETNYSDADIGDMYGGYSQQAVNKARKNVSDLLKNPKSNGKFYDIYEKLYYELARIK